MSTQDSQRIIRSADDLSTVFPLTDEQKARIDLVRQTYPMLIPPYYASLIGKAGSAVWRQCVPDMDELENPSQNF